MALYLLVLWSSRQAWTSWRPSLVAWQEKRSRFLGWITHAKRMNTAEYSPKASVIGGEMSDASSRRMSHAEAAGIVQLARGPQKCYTEAG